MQLRFCNNTQSRLAARRSDTTAARHAEVGRRWYHCLYARKACASEQESKARNGDGERERNRGEGGELAQPAGQAEPADPAQPVQPGQPGRPTQPTQPAQLTY